MYIKVLQVRNLTNGFRRAEMMEDAWSMTSTPSLCAVIFWLARDRGVVCLLAFRLVISDFFGLSIFLVLFRPSDEFLCEGWSIKWLIDKLYIYWTYSRTFLNWHTWKVLQCIYTVYNFIRPILFRPQSQPVLIFGKHIVLLTHIGTFSWVVWIILWTCHHWSAKNGQLADESTLNLIPFRSSVYSSAMSAMALADALEERTRNGV